MVEYSMIDGKLTQMMEICTGCGHQPQAPSWDQCYGCGKTGYEVTRKMVPAK